MRKLTNETMTPKQVAQQRGVTLTCVYHELWANRLPGARKVGRSWMIPVSVITKRKTTP
jgi:hypothetical protein